MRKTKRSAPPRKTAASAKTLAIAAALSGVCAGAADAADAPGNKLVAAPAPDVAAPVPLPPAPLGVFGADMPAAGKLVVSIIPQFANLSHTLKGARQVSSEEVVATTPWFGHPTLKLRLVPQNVSVASQTLALAYGITKDWSIVITGGMIERNLDMLAFKGPTSLDRLGISHTGTDGLADFTASTIYRIYADPVHRIQLNLGMSFPTGSNHNSFRLLLPDGSYATSRAFYALQPGSGTFDVLPGIVYAGHVDKWSWGLSYRGRFPLAANPEGYLFGDLHEFNGWAGYSWIKGLTTTFRVCASTQGEIRGLDPMIRGKAQAANPNFYGGQRVELWGGATIGGALIGQEALTIALEAGIPVYQSLNGPQLSKNWQAGMALRWKI